MATLDHLNTKLSILTKSICRDANILSLLDSVCQHSPKYDILTDGRRPPEDIAAKWTTQAGEVDKVDRKKM